FTATSPGVFAIWTGFAGFAGLAGLVGIAGLFAAKELSLEPAVGLPLLSTVGTACPVSVGLSSGLRTAPFSAVVLRSSSGPWTLFCLPLGAAIVPTSGAADTFALSGAVALFTPESPGAVPTAVDGPGELADTPLVLASPTGCADCTGTGMAPGGVDVLLSS